MLRVLGRTTSINVRKVLWTADELGLSCEREDWGLPLRDPNVPELLALNPNAQVPVIIDDGFVLYESNAIMRYLCERGGGGELLPAELRQRSLVEQWLSWQATELNPTWGYAVQALLRGTPGYDDASRIAHSIERWSAKMAILEAQLGQTGAYAAGGAFSLADIALGLSVHRWMALPAKKPELPDVGRYHEMLKGRAAGARYMSSEFF